MIFEWIIAGVVLLVAAIILQKVREQGGYRALIATFICLWCALLAMYFWGAVTRVVAEVLGGTLNERQIALVAYWVAFLLAAVPHGVLLKGVIKDHQTTFPPLIDAVFQWGGAVLIAGTACCLLIMSIAVAARSPREFDGRKLPFRADIFPIQAYLWTATRFHREQGQALPGEHIPQEARRLFLVR